MRAKYFEKIYYKNGKALLLPCPYHVMKIYFRKLCNKAIQKIPVIRLAPCDVFSIYLIITFDIEALVV